ncbi:MAG: GAF domain-containing protein [Ignavibacteria bacterium]|nr:GAF domain-containing protein [Ignavibacteria bacterium]MBT8382663.1 GAF domain-containing protein [Ignavibacteria bacterium]MBT8391222.1 GAF domain-containing protein [Ignavibacteria bacterium]NNJ54431.1 GAF domain-containing protein [Ignavibacteriaceae bacterium]NNL22449.1 GAF domain-containing protein [Ignavibacteriaceae bacterium]
MAEEFIIGKSLSIEEKYKLLFKELKSLLSKEENFISNLSNLTAALKDTFDKISWVGFYLFDGKKFDGNKLYLGPFQGKVACTQIDIGKGVCGTAAKEVKTLIVPDVDKFPGHIACDSDSKSEIVIPIFENKKLFGVLDIDSHEYDAFDKTDKKYLEEICNFLSTEIIN